MKILQLNTWGLRLSQSIIEVLKREKPDIVCFQEIVSFPNKPYVTSVFVGLLEEVLIKVPELSNHFTSPTLQFSLMTDKAVFGNAILSRWPILSDATVFTGNEYNADFDINSHTANIRNLQDAVIETPEGNLHVLNHHGHWIPNHKKGNEETMRQMTMISGHIQSIDGPKILCGDFNLMPDSDSLKQLNSLLTNLSLTNHLKTTRNQFSPKHEVCDYIFTSPDISVQKFAMLDDLISDHAALIAEISLP